MATLHVPIGPPAVGKSTLAAQMVVLGHLVETAVVSPDALRAQLTDDVSDQRANSAVFQIVDVILEQRMKLGLDIFLDATNLQPQHLRKVLGLAQSYGHSIAFWVFETPEDVVRQRNNLRENTVPDHAMDRMFNQYKELDIDSLAGTYGADIRTVNYYPNDEYTTAE